MRIKPLARLITGLILFGFTSLAQATPIELVINGEFENPDFSGRWTHVANDAVDGWSSTSGEMEFWNQGMIGSPSSGSDGLETGQHHEVAWNGDDEVTTQNFGILSDGILDFSFDSWNRNASGISYSLIGTLSGTLASGNYLFVSNLWESISYTGLTVKGGETLSLWFESIGGGSCGAHIDQVSVLYEAAPVPEPATMFLFGTGLIGLAGVSASRKKK